MNMHPNQWLLVGGPADGKTVFVAQGAAVRWVGLDGLEYLYWGQDFIDRDRLYRVGVLELKDLQPDRVRDLIRSSQVKHIAVQLPG